ncbi:MAG: hypothetical protein OXF99_05380 [bacterium]|nr:hypothetical protein [bacterium]
MTSTKSTESTQEATGSSPFTSDSSQEAKDRLLDAVLYAPVGLLLSVDSSPSELATRGRRHLEAARLLGRMALDHSSTPPDAGADAIDPEPG